MIVPDRLDSGLRRSTTMSHLFPGVGRGPSLLLRHEGKQGFCANSGLAANHPFRGPHLLEMGPCLRRGTPAGHTTACHT